MVEVTNNSDMLFKEIKSVSQPSYKGKTFSDYIRDNFHNSMASLLYNTHIIDLTSGKELDENAYQSYENDIVVDFNKFNVKNAPIYVFVPGKLELLLTSDLKVEYEIINDSFLKINNLHNETTADVVYRSSNYTQLPSIKGSYVLFNYEDIEDKIYEEEISINLGENEEGSDIQSLNQWMQGKGYNNYEDILKDYTFYSVLTKEAVSSRLLNKYSKSYIITLGEINNDTYFRVPKEVLFISSGVNYSMIDDRTLLIKNGEVSVIYK